LLVFRENLMNEPKKGLSPLAWIGIGCGGLLLIGIAIVSVGGYFAAKTASDFLGDNPAAAAAEALVRINPELELVESDREAGTITIREKATGKEVTVNYSQLERGELVFGDGAGEQVRIQSSATPDGGPISITGSNGSSMTIGASGAAVEVPGWLGEYPGNKTDVSGYTATSDGKRSGIYSFATNDAAAALSYYEGRLKALGLEANRSSFSGGGNTVETVQGDSGAYQISASATTTADGVRLTVTYSGPAE
jgi:hypothetical protein